MQKAPFRGFRGFNTPNNTQVPDELFDEILVHLSGAELKVLLYVIRRTYGFKRESDNISLSQMLTGIVKRDGVRLDYGTGLSKPTLLSALRSLADMGMIVPERRRSSERGDEATTYRLHLVTDTHSTGATPSTGDTEAGQTQSPVVKKFDQGEARNPTTPVGKEFGHAVVKKSAPQVTVTNNQGYKVVNPLPANDPEDRSNAGPTVDKRPQKISDPALRAKYLLTDDQIGRVHWLVEKQTEILGAADRNHGHYVKRAAEAVRDGDADFLDHQLGDFKQAAAELAVGSRPAYFHAMYREALAKRGGDQTTSAFPPRSATPPATDVPGTPNARRRSFDHLFNLPQEDDHDEKRSRMINDAERRGIAVPDYIRTADIRQVMHWWSLLPADKIKRP